MPTHTEPLSTAVAHHQAGRLAEASPLYRQTLIAAPTEPNALHLLGVISWREGDADLGVRLISRAIAVDPLIEGCYLNLGNLHRAQSRPETAIDVFERGLRALPDSVPLFELFCGMTQDRAVVEIKAGDLEEAGAWARRCFGWLTRPIRTTRTIYDLFERQIQVALITGQDDQALIALALKNRHDFPRLGANDIDLFTVHIHDFQHWVAATGVRAEMIKAPAQPAPASLFDDYPDYLREYLEALPELGRRPVGVALDASVEILQGFYVKDNYESYLVAGRRDLLYENKGSVVRSSIVPLVGMTPDGDRGAMRLPRPLYRTIEIVDPAIFVPSTPNYWHFMVEVLPRLILCDQVAEARDLPIVLFDARGYQYEMFDLAGIARERIVDVKTLVEPETVQIHYRLRRAAVPADIPYPLAYRLLRERLLPKVRGGRPPGPRRVFLSRRGSYPKHRVSNDTEVGELLARYGFQVVLPESLSVLETIELISGAEMVVAPIGAGTSNHIFLPPRGTWIHLNNPDFFHPESPWNSQMGTQATLVGHFRHLTGRFVGDPAGFPERLVDRLEIPIDIDLEALARLVEEAEARLARPAENR